MGRENIQNAQHNTEEEQSWRMTLPDSKTYYKATVIKTGQCGTGERRDKKDQWKKTERPEASHMDTVN